MNEIVESARSVPMSWRALFEGIPGRLVGGDVGSVGAVGEAHDDSRQVKPGDVFVAVRGRSVDGHDFAAKAIAQGAVALVVEREISGAAVPQLIVENAAAVLGILVARSKGDPAAQLTLIGITGTNGKTTTTYLVESIVSAAGWLAVKASAMAARAVQGDFMQSLRSGKDWWGLTRGSGRPGCCGAAQA